MGQLYLKITMAVNVELLRKTLDTIKANPEHWNQRHWHCDTNHCFAGFAELIANNLSIEMSWEQVRALRLNGKLESGTGRYAEKLLGITDDDGDVLFDPYNTLEQLERMVDHLTIYGSLEDFALNEDSDNDEE